MKQMILLEPEDLAALRHGESRTLQIGTAEIVLGYAGPVLSRNGARPVPVTAEFVCETCGKVFDATNKLGSHRFQVHKTRTAPPASAASNDRTCPTCGRVGRSRLNMLEHHRRVHGRPSPNSLRGSPRSRSHRNEEVVQPSKYRTLLCTVPTCPRSRPRYGFTKAAGLANHLKHWHHKKEA